MQAMLIWFSSWDVGSLQLPFSFLTPLVFTLINTILVLHVHWARFVGKFLYIVSHLVPPPCLAFVHIWAFRAIRSTKVTSSVSV